MFLEKLFSLLYQSELSGSEVIKNYSSWRGLKWLPAKLLLPFYPYSLSALERAAREATFLVSELPTPELKLFGKGFIVREFIEGEIVGPEGAEIAKALELAHSLCWALGDAKFDNFLKTERGIMFIDGEQAVRTCEPLKQGADLVVASVFLMLAKGCKGVAELLDSYRFSKQKLALLTPGALVLLLPCLLTVIPRALRALRQKNIYNPRSVPPSEGRRSSAGRAPPW